MVTQGSGRAPKGDAGPWWEPGALPAQARLATGVQRGGILWKGVFQRAQQRYPPDHSPSATSPRRPPLRLAGISPWLP